ncbi:MAG: histidine phosphatase family protein [Alphaproteobacteria bacterium]|nr:histidine phosphatase family protein [Alphaproteobacteria bacterium]
MMFLIRHGETEWNSAGRFQGGKDSPLTCRGRAQAEAYGRQLAGELAGLSLPLRAYVSPLGRAQETAAIIAQVVPLEIHLEPRIAEVSLGTWDGMSMYEIEMEFPGALSAAGRHDWYFRAPDGETFDAALNRVSGWLADAVPPALAVTHGLASRLIRGAHDGLSKRDMLRLPVPQDGFYRMSAGRSVLVSCA